jgi:hypothetical protein
VDGYNLITIEFVILFELLVLVELVEVAAVVVTRLALEHLDGDFDDDLIVDFDATRDALVVGLNLKKLKVKVSLIK